MIHFLREEKSNDSDPIDRSPGGAVYSYFSNQYTSASRASGDAGWVEINKIPLFMSNQGSSINISVCSPGSPRCRTDFDPRLYGINRGISGIPIN